MANRDNTIKILTDWCVDLDDCDRCPLCGFECEWEKHSDSELLRAIAIIVEGEQASTHVNTVNHPSHYQGANECIDVMRAMFGDEAVKGFCKCNAYKYRFRADRKNGAEDIRKAEWYESYLIGMDKEGKGNG